MCYGCPKWVVVAICCIVLVFLVGNLALYTLLKPCSTPQKTKNFTSDWSDLAKPDVQVSSERPNIATSLSTPTTLPMVYWKSEDKCVILKGERKTHLRAGGFMHTHFELTCNGTIQGDTTLWPEPSFFGFFSGHFSGCSEIHLYAESHRLWMGDRHKFATTSMNYSNKWSEEVPIALLPSVKKFALMHSRC